MSNAARALLDDVKARREAPTPVVQPAPFPDLDRTLQLLSADPGESGGFTFSLDPSLMSDAQDDPFGVSELSDCALESDMPFAGNFMTAFPGLRPSNHTAPSNGGFPVAPPGLAYNNTPSRAIYDPLGSRPPPPERQSTSGSNYSGAFNPFGDSADVLAGPSSRTASSFGGDEDRKTSRFGFARGRQSSATPSIASTSSPMQSMATVELSNVSTPYYASHQNSPALQSWPIQRQDFGSRSATSRTGSPFAPGQGSGHQAYAPQPSHPRQHMYDNGVSDAQLKEFLRGNQPSSQPRSIGNSLVCILGRP
jgi:CCR4-NOT transcription complex subunit 4